MEQSKNPQNIKKTKSVPVAETVPSQGFLSSLKEKRPALFIGAAFVFLAGVGSLLLTINSIEHQTPKQVPSPKKTTYTTTLPPGFPSTIPIASTSKLAQSYSKEYVDGMSQTSAVFSSDKSVFENFSLYEVFLKDGNWKILSAQRNETKSVLYGRKEGSDIEVHLRKNTATSTGALSYIIINVYKK